MAEDKKAMNVNKLPSLNVNTGEQSSSTDVKNGPYTSGQHDLSWFFKAVRNAKDPGLGKKDSLYTIKQVLGPSLGMKKGGKVKARKPKDGRIKKAKCRDGIAQRGKTRGKMR